MQAADRDVAWELAMVLGLEQYSCKYYLELPTTLEQPAPITPLTHKLTQGEVKYEYDPDFVGKGGMVVF